MKKNCLIICLICCAMASWGNESNERLNSQSTSSTRSHVVPPYTESFLSSQGQFTVYDVNLPAVFNSIWKLDNAGRYGMVAYAGQSATELYASDSWLISPYIDIPFNATSCTLSFNHAAKFFSIASNEMTLWVSTDYQDGNPLMATWNRLAIPNYPSGVDWNFVNSGIINLSQYAGQSITIAFRYVSSTSYAPKWEVKNVQIQTVLAPTYNVSASCDYSQGNVYGGGTYIAGGTVTLSAVPNTGYRFVSWSNGATANPYTFTITRDVSLFAIFEKIEDISQFWNFSDADFKSLGTISTTKIVRGLTIAATEYAPVIIDENTKHIEYITFTHRLKLRGAGATDYRVLKFSIVGNCEIDIYAESSNDDETRTLNIDYGQFWGNRLGTMSIGGQITKKTFSYSGDRTTIFIYGVTGGVNIYGIRVTSKDVPTPPKRPHMQVPYSEPFTSTQGDFMIYNVLLPNELDYVWSLDKSSNQNGMVASAALNASSIYEAESWLISPFIDIPQTGGVMSFAHTARFFSSTPSNEMSLCVSRDYQSGNPYTGSWQQITIPTYPSGSNWNFVYSGDINLSSYAGQSITVAFKYKSSSFYAPKWEVKNFCVSNQYTDIPRIHWEKEAPRKILHNGQLFILNSAGIFNSQGQRIK